jgi:hypothetical protein
MIPLSGDHALQYHQGDTLHVIVGFINNQHLRLTMAGDPDWGDTESIGLLVVDTNHAFNVSGSTSTSFNILEPTGELFMSSISQSGGFGAAQGAIVSFSSDMTDSYFYVSGFEFKMTINAISESINPDLLRIKFVNLDLGPKT